MFDRSMISFDIEVLDELKIAPSNNIQIQKGISIEFLEKVSGLSSFKLKATSNKVSRFTYDLASPFEG